MVTTLQMVGQLIQNLVWIFPNGRKLIQNLVWILLSGESMDPLKPFEWNNLNGSTACYQHLFKWYHHVCTYQTNGIFESGKI